MDWTVWILLSATFLAFYDLAKKASVRDNAVLPVLLCSTVFGCAAFAASLAATHSFAAAVGQIDGRVLALGAAKSVIVATSWIFTFTALRTLPITIATPIRASAPALVILAAFVLYGEVPSLVQGVGMAAVLGGYWAFSWAGKAEGIDFFRNRAVWCAIAGACLSAVSALWDKYVFQVAQSPVAGTQLVFQVGLILVYAICLAVSRVCSHRKPFAFQWRWTIPLVGMLLALADWLYFTGVAISDTPISVASLLRRFSVAITFALGAIFFRERNLRRKTLALAAILLGIALLCIR